MLEKILQEIEQYETKMEESGVSALCPGWVKEIIKKHLSAKDLNVPTNDGKISIDDERLWQILFDEACVEGQQADRIYKQLKEICGDGWIPAEDGMPKEKYQKNKVWITIETEKGNRATVMGYEDCGKFHFSNGNEIKKYKVIAWKPYTYPKPYRKDEE